MARNVDAETARRHDALLAELEALLSKIAPGGTLAEKLASIRDVVENGFGEDASTTTVLSYLVFMKTLTFIRPSSY